MKATNNELKHNDYQHPKGMWHFSLLHIVPFCEGPNKKSEGFAKEKLKT